MKKLLFAILLFSPVLMAFGSDPVLMTIDGVDVRLSEFGYHYHKARAVAVDTLSADEYIDMFVDYKLKVKAAAAAGVDTTMEFRMELRQMEVDLAQSFLADTAGVDSLLRELYVRMERNVDVSHILLDSGDSILAGSLQKIVAEGGDIAPLAAKYSVDVSAKSDSGRIGYLSVGMLPYEFENVAFALPDGGVSEVVSSRYGLHIIKSHGSRSDPGEVKVRHILKMTAGLSAEDSLKKVQEIDSIYGLLTAGADFKEIASVETDDPSGRDNGGDLPWFGVRRMVPEFEKAAFEMADSTFSRPVRTMYGYHILFKEASRKQLPFDEAVVQLREIVEADGRAEALRKRRMERAVNAHGSMSGVIEWLKAENPEYAALVREYREGLMVVNVSADEVWNRPDNDREGLCRYFDAHRADFAWKSPRFKGFIIMAEADSVAVAAREWLDSTNVASVDIVQNVRRQFGTDVRVERVLAPVGVSGVVDFVAFGGARPASQGRWNAYLPYRYRVIAQPESVDDVRGQASAAYQKELEKEWLLKLHKQYTVKINDKALRSLEI